MKILLALMTIACSIQTPAEALAAEPTARSPIRVAAACLLKNSGDASVLLGSGFSRNEALWQALIIYGPNVHFDWFNCITQVIDDENAQVMVGCRMNDAENPTILFGSGTDAYEAKSRALLPATAVGIGWSNYNCSEDALVTSDSLPLRDR